MSSMRSASTAAQPAVPASPPVDIRHRRRSRPCSVDTVNPAKAGDCAEFGRRHAPGPVAPITIMADMQNPCRSVIVSLSTVGTWSSTRCPGLPDGRSSRPTILCLPGPGMHKGCRPVRGEWYRPHAMAIVPALNNQGLFGMPRCRGLGYMPKVQPNGETSFVRGERDE